MRLANILLIGMAVGAVSAAPGRADPAAGQAAFDGNGCADCHYTEGPARELTIADQLAKKGPELWYAGSKFQAPWLEQWLQDPKPIRSLKYNSLTEDNPGDHPSLGEGDAAAVAEFLMTLTSDVVEAGVIKPKRNPKGRLVFTKKMPCSGCHQFPTKKKFSGGRTGPSLVGASERLNPDWIYAYLSQTAMFKPVRMMPVFTGLLSDKDMQAVSAYVANFK
ncbi:MAG: c-type cytochrome [Alphaproteobacteria bacterium]|jgi:mono/diheme cytochrome c family protein|nr:c-type cytochrome [Alphaproteobacteria bacterium]|tara:strand:+ start:250 stop:909 length:660 start_codon:yes stop_codon:yes gene_type:complete